MRTKTSRDQSAWNRVHFSPHNQRNTSTSIHLEQKARTKMQSFRWNLRKFYSFFPTHTHAYRSRERILWNCSRMTRRITNASATREKCFFSEMKRSKFFESHSMITHELRCFFLIWAVRIRSVVNVFMHSRSRSTDCIPWRELCAFFFLKCPFFAAWLHDSLSKFELLTRMRALFGNCTHANKKTFCTLPWRGIGSSSIKFELH